MKNIRNYCPAKYKQTDYQEVEPDIYKTLYADKSRFVGITDRKLIRKLRRKKDWVFCEDNHFYMTEYENKKYYRSKQDYLSRNRKNFYATADPTEIYVTSLMFEPEPLLGENEPSDKNISQYPLEDILDKFRCFCLDFYPDENENDSNNSYQEFASSNIEHIRNLRSIIGKHVYNKEEEGHIKLIIE